MAWGRPGMAGAVRRGLLALSTLVAWTGSAAFGADSAEELNDRLERGEVALRFEAGQGYLTSLLQALEIPISSQLLVFSKTSAQFRLISPRNPRAIYFSDDTYVGWVPGAPLLEVSTARPDGGAAFYTLEQARSPAPRLIRDNGSCLQCHESRRTLGVAGHLTRSVFPGPDGLPHFRHGTVDVDHATPLRQRWGGWLVTGLAGVPHRGNAFGSDEQFGPFGDGRLERPTGAWPNRDRYPTRSSDVVAHLVLAHQTLVHNAIANAAIAAREATAYQRNMEQAFGEPSESVRASVRRRIEGAGESLLRALLMVGEAPLERPVAGDSSFAEEFQQRATPGSLERSLRELDLDTRLFKHPCSFLIESDAYAGLPGRVREYVRTRIGEIVAGRDRSGAFGHLDASDRARLGRLLSERLRSP